MNLVLADWERRLMWSLASWIRPFLARTACDDFARLAVIRFLLGVSEAALLPCLLLVNPKWYGRNELSTRTAFWYNTYAGVFGGILSYAIGHFKGGLPTWKVG